MERFRRTFDRFEKALEKFKEVVEDQRLEGYLSRDLLVEVTVKRFEYTFEAMWKTIKEFLRTRGIECFSPKSCFSALLKEGIISYDLEAVLVRMVMVRNLLVHVYDETQAFELFEEIRKGEFLRAFCEIREALGEVEGV